MSSDDSRAAPAPIRPVSWRERESATQLPVPLTPFIGRERESRTAIDLLRSEEVRLLTLTGPGGAGKSRLALHIASKLAEELPDGVVYVALSTVNDPALVLSTIANCHGIRDTTGQPAAHMLNALLLNQRELLVLDNFEQVVEAGPDLADLLAACPALKILVTSQVPLHIHGEQELPIPPLEIPPAGIGTTWKVPPLDEIAGYDAVALFLSRAHSVQPDFELTEDNVLAVTEICRRLDGLPLAIELAAARIKLLSPSALLSRLATRLGILTSGARDLPPRLQTMRAAIGWSYDLLEPAEQALFRRLAVFSGGFTLEAAEAIATQDDLTLDIFDGVASLVDKSLLRPADSPTGEPRFTMLETIREFGVEQLDEYGMNAAIRTRHAQWCADLAAQAGPQMNGWESALWMDRLEAEHDNIRAALGWLIEMGEAETALAIMTDIWFFWIQRSYYTEGRAWFERALANRPQPSPMVATALAYAGVFAEAGGDFDGAIQQLEESRTMASALDDASSLAKAVFGLADVHDNLMDYERALPLFEEAATLFGATGESAWRAVVLANLAVHAHRAGDDDLAGQHIRTAVEICSSAGFTWGSAYSLHRSGQFAADTGDFQRASEVFQQCFALWRELGDRWRITRAMINLADVAARTDHPERAVHLLAAAEAFNEPLAVSLRFGDDTPRARALTLARAQLDEAAFESAWAIGRSLSLDEALAEAAGPPAPEQAATSPTPATETDSSHRLTARELEVLQLLVAGHSDRQIAEALFISPRTAQSHVASIFTKLGVNSRTAAATAAIRAGLATDTTQPAGTSVDKADARAQDVT